MTAEPTDAPPANRAVSDDAELARRARDVLDGNWTGRSTIPAPGLYPHQWNWDTGFIAIGRSIFDQARAERELLHLFEGQWRTGMLPHIVFNPDVARDAYFPGPDFWRSRTAYDSPRAVETSGLTQPPVHGFAALEMHRRAADADQSEAFLRELFPGLVALHRYFRDHRPGGPEGLTYVLHPWETGLDNSPSWDDAFEAFEIPKWALPRYQRRDLVHADPRDRPSDDAYDRFVYLAILYRDAGYDDARVREITPFLVEDPMFNALWAWSAASLAEIAGVIGEDGREFAEDAERITRAIETKLWDAEHARFLPFDLHAGRQMDHHSVVSFVPLVAPGLDSDKAHQTAESMNDVRHCRVEDVGSACFILPTYQPGDADYNPRLYWRGPIWINTNWLLERGTRAAGETALADELRESSLELVRGGGFREYFDPHTGTGYGADRFSWTAALALDLLER
jgi:Trehalase